MGTSWSSIDEAAMQTICQYFTLKVDDNINFGYSNAKCFAAPEVSTTGSVRCCISPQLTLSLNQCIIAVAIAIVATFALISTLGSFSFLNFVVSLLLWLAALLLGVAALVDTAFVATYFRFVLYPLGSGFLLLTAGTLVIGLHPAGQIVGYAAIVWGIVAMAVHVWLRVYIGKATAVNVPLANFWRNRDSHASSDKASSTSSVQVQWPPAVPAAASARL